MIRDATMLIASPGGCLIVCEDKALFVRQGKRGGKAAAALLKDYAEWAISHGVREVNMGLSIGVKPEAAGKLLEHLGFKQNGALYRRRLS